MTDFDEDEVQEWEKLDGSSTWREEQPYRLCPRCGSYKFRTIKRHPRGDTLNMKVYTYREKCKNCKYRGEEWEEERD